MQPQILVIENDLETAQIIELELTYENYQVNLVQDGIAGLVEARQHNPNLLILALVF